MKEKVVIVTIHDGEVQKVETPVGVKVIVRNYDVNQGDDFNERGDKYSESIWK